MPEVLPGEVTAISFPAAVSCLDLENDLMASISTLIADWNEANPDRQFSCIVRRADDPFGRGAMGECIADMERLIHYAKG